MMRDSRAGSSRPSSRSNSHGAVLLRHQPPLQPVGKTRDDALQMRELLVEIAAQPVELFCLAQVFSGNRLVEFGGEGPIVRSARFVRAKMARSLRLAGRFGITHVGVIGHIGSRRLDRFGRGIGHVLGGHLRVLHAHALHFVGIGGIAIFAGLLLAAILLAFVLLVLRVAAAVLAHFESIQQIMNDIAELSLILDQILQPVEIASGALLDQRTPQIDKPLGRRRRSQAGQTLAHHHAQARLRSAHRPGQ